MYAVGMIVWFFGIFGSLHLGFIGLGYNIFDLPIFMTTLSVLVVPIHYIIGLSGIVSLFMFVKAMQCKGASMCSCNMCGNGNKKGCGCGRPNCNCGSNNKSATKTM